MAWGKVKTWKHIIGTFSLLMLVYGSVLIAVGFFMRIAGPKSKGWNWDALFTGFWCIPVALFGINSAWRKNQVASALVYYYGLITLTIILVLLDIIWLIDLHDFVRENCRDASVPPDQCDKYYQDQLVRGIITLALTTIVCSSGVYCARLYSIALKNEGYLFIQSQQTEYSTPHPYYQLPGQPSPRHRAPTTTPYYNDVNPQHHSYKPPASMLGQNVQYIDPEVFDD